MISPDAKAQDLVQEVGMDMESQKGGGVKGDPKSPGVQENSGPLKSNRELKECEDQGRLMTSGLGVSVVRLNPSLGVTAGNASMGWKTATVARNKGSAVYSQLLPAAAYENRMILPWNAEKAACRHTFTGIVTEHGYLS